jgi:hypothetical protein
VDATVGEYGGRGYDPGPHPGLEVPPHPRPDGVASPIGLESVEIEPEPSRSVPEVRVFEPALIGEQLIVHLPEAAL